MDQIINENHSQQATVMYIPTFHKAEGKLYDVLNSPGLVWCQNPYSEICCLSGLSSKGSISRPTAGWAGDGNIELCSFCQILLFCSGETQCELLMNSF